GRGAQRGAQTAAPPAGPEAVAQLAGTWNLTVHTPEGDQPATLTVTQSGDVLDGSLQSALGTAAIVNGRVSGSVATWSVTLPIQGQTTTIAFRGQADGNRMTGTASLGEMGTITFTAEKTP
ncbi:MAG: hypothetical protein M3373_11620, partial [Gemmatimonadota bacterium]|nr:hypothetical protein [Gemmatimonadota bacterium]